MKDKKIRSYSNNKLEYGDAIITRTMQALKLTPAFAKYRLFCHWADIVGEDMARYITPQKLRFGVLYVHARSSAWANNFQYLKTEIIAEINNYTQAKTVKDIQFTRFAAKGKKQYSPILEQRVNLGSYLHKVPLDKDDIQQAKNVVADVSDSDLQMKIKQVYLKGIKLRKVKQKYGWHKCRRCGRLTPGDDGYCNSCMRNIKQEKLENITEIFLAIPWARYQDIVKYVQCDMDMVNKQRQKLVQMAAARLVPDVDYPDKNKNIVYSRAAKRVVMLYKSIAPDKLSDIVVAETIRKLRIDTAYHKYKKKR